MTIPTDPQELARQLDHLGATTPPGGWKAVFAALEAQVGPKEAARIWDEVNVALA